MTALPPLSLDISSTVTPLKDVVEMIYEDVEGGYRELVEALLWKIDTSNAETFLLKEKYFDPRGTISLEDFENQQDLPPHIEDFFMDEGFTDPDIVVRSLWEAYYLTVKELAHRHSSRFLIEYFEMEIGLRNAIAKVRAEKLGLDVENSQILSGEDAFQYSSLVLRASEESDPQARELLIDKVRLEKLEELEGIDPFSIDAVLTYLAGAIILDSWTMKKDVDPEKILEVFV
jgi:Protein of unknown function (DUF2764)